MTIETRLEGFVIGSEFVRNGCGRLNVFNGWCGGPAHRADCSTPRIAIFTGSAGDGFVAYRVRHVILLGAGVLVVVATRL